jgi:hypothetical protein
MQFSLIPNLFGRQVNLCSQAIFLQHFSTAGKKLLIFLMTITKKEIDYFNFKRLDFLKEKISWRGDLYLL